ncbi:MAG: nuclear transport factor 2 family protein [Bacteroidota bacterium]
MNRRPYFFVLLFPLLSLTSCHWLDWDDFRPQPPEDRTTVEEDYRELVATEKKFAAFTEENGTPEGFLAFLADDALLFRDGEYVLGIPFYEQNPSSGILSWKPQYADISRSGDLGYTTGPFEFRNSPEDPPSGFGHYISVWEKVDTATWKVVFDLGSFYSPPSDSFPDLVFPSKYPRKISSVRDTTGLVAALIAQDSAFAQLASTENLQAAYELFLAESPILFRSGSRPFDIPDEVQSLIVSANQQPNLTPIGGKTSMLGDPGYVYGLTEQEGGPPTAYLHIWKYEQWKGWRIVVEVLSIPTT